MPKPPTFRQVPAETLFQTALTGIGRLACAHADPAGVDHPHDHSTCLVDDQDYAADLILHLVATIATGDEGAMLDALDHVASSVKRDAS